MSAIQTGSELTSTPVAAIVSGRAASIRAGSVGATILPMPVAETSAASRAGTRADVRAEISASADGLAHASAALPEWEAGWEIERAVIRGRTFDFRRRFLPPALSLAACVPFLNAFDLKALSHIQARSYIGLSAWAVEHAGHAALRRRVGLMLEEGMPEGYAPAEGAPAAQAANDAFCLKDDGASHGEGHREPHVAGEAGASASDAADAWARLAIQWHGARVARGQRGADPGSEGASCPLWRDVASLHRQVAAEREGRAGRAFAALDDTLPDALRDRALNGLIARLAALDEALRRQAVADASYFLAIATRRYGEEEQVRIGAALAAAYRWQHLGAGAAPPTLPDAMWLRLAGSQRQRLVAALWQLAGGVAAMRSAPGEDSAAA